MRVTHVRPAPSSGLGYRLAICLHTRHDIDAQLSDLDLRALSRPEIREILAGSSRGEPKP